MPFTYRDRAILAICLGIFATASCGGGDAAAPGSHHLGEIDTLAHGGGGSGGGRNPPSSSKTRMQTRWPESPSRSRRNRRWRLTHESERNHRRERNRNGWELDTWNNRWRKHRNRDNAVSSVRDLHRDGYCRPCSQHYENSRRQSVGGRERRRRDCSVRRSRTRMETP